MLRYHGDMRQLRPVSELVEEAGLAAQSNLERATSQHRVALGSLQKQLKETFSPSTNKAMRLTRVRFIAGQWSGLLQPFSACRFKCSHCCHIDTDLPRSEAQLIAKKTGAKLLNPATRPAGTEQSPANKFLGVPCPFLNKQGCSIYEDRPLACRTLVSLADDAQLCELRPGEVVPVPYANATALQAAFVAVTQHEDWADIRDWFGTAPLK